ncbi:MAG: YkgJ family cysteine cluster protein [Deltaproteobacteria bacterium]|nr:YkgJ family cysteine cluster protein [Deltaproteobacteria bacterium]
MREYSELIRRVDEVAQALEKGVHQKRLQCRAGCRGCCTLSSVLPLEAAMLRHAVARLDEGLRMRIRHNSGESPCPFLLDSLCAIYPSRPLICRTHGLPIAYVDHARQTVEVSACPLNFSDLYEFSQDELLFIDPFNAELAQLNSAYCAGQGIPAEVRVLLADIACFGIRTN